MVTCAAFSLSSVEMEQDNVPPVKRCFITVGVATQTLQWLHQRNPSKYHVHCRVFIMLWLETVITKWDSNDDKPENIWFTYMPCKNKHKYKECKEGKIILNTVFHASLNIYEVSPRASSSSVLCMENITSVLFCRMSLLKLLKSRINMHIYIHTFVWSVSQSNLTLHTAEGTRLCSTIVVAIGQP